MTTLADLFRRDGELPLGDELSATVAAWLDHMVLDRGLSEGTREAYGRDLVQFLAHIKSERGRTPVMADLEKLDTRTIRGFLARRRRQGVSGRTLAGTMSALRMFFRWLEATETLKNRAILTVAMPKVPHGVPKPLTVGHAADTIAEADTAEMDWIGARDTAVLLLLYGSGLRISEALGLLVKARADARSRRAAHRRQGREGARGAGHCRDDRGHRALSRALPLPARPR